MKRKFQTTIIVLIFGVTALCAQARVLGGDTWMRQINSNTMALRGWILLTEAPETQDSLTIDWGDALQQDICLGLYPFTITTQGALVQYEVLHSYSPGGYNVFVTGGKRVPYIRNIPNSENTNYMSVIYFEFYPNLPIISLPLADSVNFEVEMNVGVTNIIPQNATDANGDSIRFYKLSAPAVGFVQPEIAGGGTFTYSSGNGYYSWNPDTAGLYVLYFGVYEYRLSPSMNWVSYGVHTREVLIDAGSVSSVNQNQTESSVSVVPNPSAGFFSLTCSQDISSLSVYDVHGRTINNFKSYGNSATVDLSEEPAGVYFCTIQCASGFVKTVRLINSAD